MPETSKQFAKKESLRAYEEKSKIATKNALMELERLRVNTYNTISESKIDIKSYKRKNPWEVSKMSKDDLLTAYISLEDELMRIIKESEQYISNTETAISNLKKENKSFKEQDEYNQNELNNYIDELDRIEKEHENTFLINKKTIEHLEDRIFYMTIYSFILCIYSFLIGSYGLLPIIYYHYIIIIYHPIMFILHLIHIV